MKRFTNMKIAVSPTKMAARPLSVFIQLEKSKVFVLDDTRITKKNKKKKTKKKNEKINKTKSTNR